MSRTHFPLLGILLFLLSGCDKQETTHEPNRPLTIAIESDVVNFNPWVNNSVNAGDIFGLIYTPLFREESKWNAPSEFIPDWVSSMKFSEDSLTLNLTLRNDVYWSDGVKASAYDVEFSHGMLSSDSTGIYRSSKENIQSVSANDSFSVIVRFHSRSLYQIMDLNDGYILPKHIFKSKTISEIKKDESYQNNPVTNGVFKIERHVPNNEIRLIRIKKMSDPLSVNSITFRVVQDPFVRINLMKTGEIDILPNIASNQLNAISDTAHFKLKASLYPSTEYIIFNLENPIFKNRRVRKFIYETFDKSLILKNALNNEGEILNTVFPNGLWVNDSTVTENKTLTTDERKQLLTLLKSKSLTLKIASTNDLRIRVGYEIKRQLAEIGVDVRLELLPMDVLANSVRSGKYEMAIWGTREGTKPNLSLRYFKSGIGTTNLTRYSNPEFERIHNLAASKYDASESSRYWKQLQKMLLDDAVIVPLFQRKKIDVFSGDIIYSESNMRSILNNIDRWKISRLHEK